MGPFEAVLDGGTSLVRAQAFDGHLPFVLVEEARCRDVVVEFPVTVGRTNDRDKAGKEEDTTKLSVIDAVICSVDAGGN